MEFEILEEKIDYRFKERELLKRALTHSSFGETDGAGRRFDNERLEFLGDAFLDAIAGEELFKRTEEGEGSLTKLRSQVVSERALSGIGRDLELGKFLRLGKGERMSGIGNNDSIIADTLEAIIGAVYLDGGFSEARRVTLKLTEGLMENALAGHLFTDYKSRLQEVVQKKGGKNRIEYQVQSQEGPDHDKTFHVVVKVNDKVCGSGAGSSKKEAEFRAAEEALKKEVDNLEE